EPETGLPGRAGEPVRNDADNTSLPLEAAKTAGAIPGGWSFTYMLNLFRSELFRMRKRSQSWILIVTGIVLVGFFYGAFLIAALALSGSDQAEVKDGLRLANIQENGMSIAVLFASILLTIMGASLIGSEFSWNTIRPLLARATSRS